MRRKSRQKQGSQQGLALAIVIFVLIILTNAVLGITIYVSKKKGTVTYNTTFDNKYHGLPHAGIKKGEFHLRKPDGSAPPILWDKNNQPAPISFKSTKGHKVTVKFEFFEKKCELEGDVNLDKTVNAVDLNIIALHWNQPGTREEGDLTGDGMVDQDDLNIVSANWQQSCP
ncbi:hypothetical protein BVX98_06610 [bacterium F11]|nr:hypothetical protein BVX98_06610 [bacterium F11]